MLSVFDAPQDAVCALGCQGTLLTHTEPAVNQNPQIPFCRAAFQSFVFFHLVTKDTEKVEEKAMPAFP